MRGLARMLVPEQRAATNKDSSGFAVPERWLRELTQGEQTYTGKNLSIPGSFRLGAVYACINARAEDMSKLPLGLFERGAKGERTRLRETPQAELLRRPNVEQSWPELLKILIWYKLGWGQAFCETVREGDDRTGTPSALWSLLPSRTKAIRFEGVKVVTTWKDTESGLEPVVLLPGEYIQLPDVGFDGLNGKSRIELARQGIALGLAQEEWTARFYGNNASPEFFVSVPSVLKKEQRDELRQAFWEEHGGLEQARRQGFLWGGATVEQTGMISPKDQDLVIAREFQDVDVFGLFRVPPHKGSRLKHGAAFASIVESEHAYVRDALMPDAKLIQEVFWWELLNGPERKKQYFEFNFRDLLRGTPKDEAEALFKATGAPWMSRSEARERQNLGPGDPSYSKPLQPLNMADPDQAQAIHGDDGTAARSQDALPAGGTRHRGGLERRSDVSALRRHRLHQAQRAVFVRAIERFLAVELKTVSNSIRRAEDVLKLQRSLELFYGGFLEVISRELLPVVQSFAELVALEVGDEISYSYSPHGIESLALAFTTSYSRRHIGASQGQLAKIVSAEAESSWQEAQTSLDERVEEWREKRAGKIVTGIVVQAGGFLAMELYAIGGILEKVWRQVGGSCPLCASLDGSVVGIREAFGSKGGKISPDPSHEDAEFSKPIIIKRDLRHPPVHRGCDCVIAGA